MTASSPFRPLDLAKNPFLGPVAAIPTPFDREERSAAVPADAPEGSYTYAMIPSAEQVDTSEVDSTRDALEVEVRWGDQVLHLAHLSPARSFWVGEEEQSGIACDVLVPESQLGATRMPLVLVDERGEAWAVIAPSAIANLDAKVRAAAEPCAELAGALKVRLGQGATLETQVGDFGFRVAQVRAARRVAGVGKLDRKHAAATVGSALLHGAFLAALAFMMPPLGASSEEGIDDDQQYRLLQAISALSDKEKERAEEQKSDDAAKQEEGGTGKRAVGDEGKMGSETSKATNKRFALKGDAQNKDLMVPREVALREAQDFGMIGILRDLNGADPNAPVAPWGEQLVGNEALSARGNMWGESIGEAAGAGGLGLSGIGEGGGGKYLGIGLGDIGTIGHGAGNCTTGNCQGFGNSGGRLATGHGPATHRMRPGTTEVGGRMPAEVIQRIVRQNFGRFRGCYETGLRNSPNLAGRVAVRFVIGRDGAVGSAANGGSDLPDQAVVSCVVRAFMGLSFPAPENGIVTVTYPISFSPG